MVILTSLWLLFAPQGDSTAVLRHARQAQAGFEWQRKARLPLVALRRTGECDARIGRFCYWHDDSPMDSQPEPRAIAEARDWLIRVLDSAARAFPADEWLAGQRVRYLLESGRPVEALEATRDCGATPWWCAALQGLVRHATQDYAGADSAYRSALGDMPPGERCRWTDLSPLLGEPLRHRYRRLGCAARADVELRLWRLAQPLLSRPGNDRRTEHYARLTMARLLRRASSPYGTSGGDDLTELIVRYGWPVTWAQGVSSSSVTAERVVIGHEREPAYHFLDDAIPVDDLATGPTADLQTPDVNPRERYAPVYAATFTALDPEFAVFRRGESTLVVAAYDLARDSVFRGHTLDAALVLARDERTAPVVHRRAGTETAGVLVAAAPWWPRVLSLEVAAWERHRAARARIGPRSPTSGGGRVTLSNLLVFEPSDSSPRDLAAALPHARPAVVARGSRIGLYWEVYGLAVSGEPLATAVSVIPERIGWLRRAAESLHLTARPRLVRLEWDEEGTPREGIATRALVVDLSTLAPGRYRIAVAVAPRDHVAVVASRTIRIATP